MHKMKSIARSDQQKRPQHRRYKEDQQEEQIQHGECDIPPGNAQPGVAIKIAQTHKVHHRHVNHNQIEQPFCIDVNGHNGKRNAEKKQDMGMHREHCMGRELRAAQEEERLHRHE